MTKDDIIKLATEAGLYLATDANWMPIINLAYAEKFAKLVAAAEREEILQMSREKWFKTQADFEAAIAARWKHD